MLSGGMGSLGLLVANWLASSEDAPLWLLGRSGRGQNEDLRTLYQSGGRISAKRCDSSCTEEATSVVSEHNEMLLGLVHAGGVLQDAIVSNLTIDQCRSVFAPKIAGLHNIARVRTLQHIQKTMS